MLSSSNLKSAQASSYFEKDDYYSKEEGPGGSRWLGKGAEQLGLEGGVDQEQFTEILKGTAPNGEKLFSRKLDQSKRRAATDFTFSAPKSVSVAGLVQGDGRVIEAHHLAVKRTLAILEERYAETRVMTAQGRRIVGTGNIIAAVFAHGTSREAEPQLHSHCVVMNATQIENGRWYGLLNDSAVANKKLLGQIYQNELACELKTLGYEIEQREHGQFDIKGYSEELLKTFSTRRGQIEELVAQWQESGRVVRDADGNAINSELLIREAANLKTRKVKPQVTAAGELLQNWQAVLAMKGLELPPLPGEQNQASDAVAESGAAIATPESEQSSETVETPSEPVDVESEAAPVESAEPAKPKAAAPKQRTVLGNAIAHCEERDAIFKRKNIETFVLEHSIGEQSFATLQQDIDGHSNLIKVKKDKKGREQVTTESALHRELATIRLMQAGEDSVEAIASAEQVAERFEDSTLSEEQRQAIAISCAATDQVIGWQGSAGAGKTFALNSFRQIAEEQGYKVSGYAPSAVAAHELGESLSIETNTVARLLVSEPFQTEADSKPQIWFIDEAGLLSMKDARALLEKAKAASARVVLVGDTKQLSAVEAGNPFRSMQAAGMLTARLDEARRQKREDLRQAVNFIARAEVDQGIEVLATGGCIHTHKEAGARQAQLIETYLQMPGEERAETLVLAGTNDNRLAITKGIRQGLQSEGALGQDTFTMQSLQRKDLTEAQGRYAKSYQVGDAIVPIHDYKGLGLEKNVTYVVTAVDVVSNTLTLETPDQQTRQIKPDQCAHKSTYTVLGEAIAPGDKLKWTKNNREEDTRNGQQFTVTGIAPTGAAQIVDEAGNERVIDLNGHQHIDYAWVSTTYGSQGKTADNVLALVDQSSNQEAFYVAVSRAKHQLNLYTPSVEELQKFAQRSRANQNVSDFLTLFEVVTDGSSTTADHAREVARDAGNSLDKRQRTATSTDSDSEQADIGAGVLTANYVQEFSDVPERVKDYVERREVGNWAQADAEQIDHSVEQVERTAGAVAGLHRRIEHEVGQRAGDGAMGAKLARRRRVAPPKLKSQRKTIAPPKLANSQHPVAPQKTETRKQAPSPPKQTPPLRPPSVFEDLAQPSPTPIAEPVQPEPVSVPSVEPVICEPVELKPPAEGTSLKQQLDDFTQVLGYQPGDRLYVRALLPKNLSDELALKHNLRFEIEENGKKRLIPNTRRGYLTVGSWEFTHVRKNKEPAVYEDGLTKLLELNQEGRGVYFVVNPGGEHDAKISEARSLFWECDDKSKPEQIEQARTSGLPLGAMIETNKSVHCYSPLSAPVTDLDDWKKLQERTIQRMDGDEAIRNSSRLMRLPGFDHVRVGENGTPDEQLIFTPVTLRHLDPSAQDSVEALETKLPQWDEERWGKEAKSRAAGKRGTGQAAAPTLAADNPWDIRNFSQYLNGDQYSMNGWLQVQCPGHGKEGSSGTSLGINEATGQFTCHSGCDKKDVYRAARELAESRGWEPLSQAEHEETEKIEETVSSKKPLKKEETQPQIKSPVQAPILEDEPKRVSKHKQRWRKYAEGITASDAKTRDYQIVRRALADGLSKQAVISLMAKSSPTAQAIYKERGSSPAYNYIEEIINAAIRKSKEEAKQARRKLSSQKPVLGDESVHSQRWRKFAQGVSVPPGKQRDAQVALKAAAAGLRKKDITAMLMYQSPVTRKLIKDEGTTPAHHYASRVTGEAISRVKAKTQHKSPDIGQ